MIPLIFDLSIDMFSYFVDILVLLTENAFLKKNVILCWHTARRACIMVLILDGNSSLWHGTYIRW